MSLPDTFGDLKDVVKTLLSVFCIRINVLVRTNFFAHEVCLELSSQSSRG